MTELEHDRDLATVTPFRGNDIAEVLRAVIGAAPVPPRELVAEVPAELETICLQGLAKSPAERQRSVVELAAQVQRWHAGHMRQYIGDPQFRMMVEGRALHARHRDGSEFAVDISLSPVEGSAGLLVCCALRPRRA